MMKHLYFLSVLLICCVLLSCQADSNAILPAMQTEIVMLQTDLRGKVISFDTDFLQHYNVTNNVQTNLEDSLFRCLCTYVDEGAGSANVRQLKWVSILSSSFEGPMKQDPTGVQSVWITPSYLNLHLYPRTKGGNQKWAYKQDSTYQNSKGGISYFISLYHHQLTDVAAYSTHFYASIPLDSVAAQRINNDSLYISIAIGASQYKTWKFGF